jgi:predicted nuclease of restriction endonuclease-like (RecB) superfamily
VSIEHGWSRNVLTHHISTQLREREGKALTNFSRTLPAEDSDLTQQILKDPYSFEFLTLSSSAKERELERGLLGPAPALSGPFHQLLASMWTVIRRTGMEE